MGLQTFEKSEAHKQRITKIEMFESTPETYGTARISFALFYSLGGSVLQMCKIFSKFWVVERRHVLYFAGVMLFDVFLTGKTAEAPGL